MTDLFPTPTRLALLRDIHDRKVITDIVADKDVVLLFPDAPETWDTRQTVTARARELEQAGWAGEDKFGIEWVLSDAGQQVLDRDELRRALTEAAFDPLPLPGTVWQDMHAASYLPAGHRRLVKVTSVGNTVTGWQVRVAADNDVPPNAEPTWPAGPAGVIYVKHLLADYKLVGG